MNRPSMWRENDLTRPASSKGRLVGFVKQSTRHENSRCAPTKRNHAMTHSPNYIDNNARIRVRKQKMLRVVKGDRAQTQTREPNAKTTTQMRFNTQRTCKRQSMVVSFNALVRATVCLMLLMVIVFSLLAVHSFLNQFIKREIVRSGFIQSQCTARLRTSWKMAPCLDIGSCQVLINRHNELLLLTTDRRSGAVLLRHQQLRDRSVIELETVHKSLTTTSLRSHSSI